MTGNETANRIQHGGDVYRNRIDLDYSVSINRLPLPETVVRAAEQSIRRLDLYPDIDSQKLTEAIAAYEHEDPSDIICGNGASELFMAVCHTVTPKLAAVTAPCYAGYGWAVGASGGELVSYRLSKENGFALDEGILEFLTDGMDMLFLADPNNPTGKRIDGKLLQKIREACLEKDILLVTDECFYPLTKGGEKAGGHPEETVTVRAFTKIFGLPGLRLGYAVIKNKKLNAAVRRNLPEWNVSVPAQEIGLAAAEVLRYSDYMERSLEMIEEEKTYLSGELEKTGVRVYPGDANFFLLESSRDLYDRLLRKGILVRSCANFEGLGPQFVRIAVRKHEDNERFIQAVKEIYERD